MKILINHMSNYFKAALLIGTITLVSCEKRLDVVPTASIADNLALNTEGDVLVTLIGAYDGAQGAAAYGGDIMVLNDLIGNSTNINFTGTFAGLSDAYQTQMVSDNSFATGTWAACYNAINRCNNVLSAVSKVTSSAAKKNSVEGEALMLRASLYFELVKLYAKSVGDGDYATNLGVPLVLTPTGNVTSDNYPARATVKAVYDRVIADLTKAETLLPNSNGNYVTKWAAAAQLSRVYLMLKDYPAARDAANRVITGSGKSLAANFGSNWFTFINNAGATPGEYLFSLKVTTQDGTNSQNTYFGRNVGIAGTAGRSDCKIKLAHINTYETGDFRKGYFTLSGGNYYTNKHLDRFGDVAIIRLAEMFLTRAECNQRLSTSTGSSALDDINRIRTRVGLASLSTVSLADITKERSLELAFEGHSLAEAKRLQTSYGALQWNDPKLVLPIPRRETDVNKNLVQNTGY